MSKTIALKKSSVSGRVPLIDDLNYGELALNYTDGLLYFKNSSNQIKSFTSKGLEIASISGTTQGTPISDVKRLVFDQDTGFNLTEISTGVVKVSLNSTFKTWKVTGQDDLVAVGEDTIRIEAGDGISLTTNKYASIKTLTINATGTGGGTVVLGSLDGGLPNSIYGGTAPIDGGGI